MVIMGPFSESAGDSVQYSTPGSAKGEVLVAVGVLLG